MQRQRRKSMERKLPQEVRTSIIMSAQEAERIKASAKEDKRGWTNQLVVLANEALDARDAAKAAAQ
jgi:hypothetical protein